MRASPPMNSQAEDKLLLEAPLVPGVMKHCGRHHLSSMGELGAAHSWPPPSGPGSQVQDPFQGKSLESPAPTCLLAFPPLFAHA